MALVANGDHGYDIRFADSSGSQTDAGKALFKQILQGIAFQ
jgi:hypothetical protein